MTFKRLRPYLPGSNALRVSDTVSNTLKCAYAGLHDDQVCRIHVNMTKVQEMITKRLFSGYDILYSSGEKQ